MVPFIRESFILPTSKTTAADTHIHHRHIIPGVFFCKTITVDYFQGYEQWNTQ